MFFFYLEGLVFANALKVVLVRKNVQIVIYKIQFKLCLDTKEYYCNLRLSESALRVGKWCFSYILTLLIEYEKTIMKYFPPLLPIQKDNLRALEV